MKRARKFVSAVLAVLMVTSAFSMLTFSASAAETTEKNEITVTSNVADPVTYSYSADSEQFTVTYKFQSDLKLINNQAYFTYDSTKLKLTDTNKQKTCVPVFSEGGSTVSNFAKADKILFNSSSLDLYDFTTENTYFTATFDIIGTGATTLDLTLQVMTATQATSYDDVFDYPEIKLARYDVINRDLFKMTCMGQVTPEVVPTTQPTTVAPTTVAPTTQPTTVAPTEPTTEPVTYAATLYVAAPTFKEGTKWDNLYLTYSPTSNVSSATKVLMTKTDKLYYLTGNVAGSLSTNVNLNVYKVDLTAEQVSAIDSANYTGFTNENNKIRTNYIWANSVFRANVDSTGYKSAKNSVSSLNGKMFVMTDATTTTNKTTFLGNWVSDAGSAPVATIYSASPVVNNTTSMGDMYFRYGTNSTVSAAAQIKMEKTDYLYTCQNPQTTMLKAGAWNVYKMNITEAQAKAIDACNYTGFTSEYGADVRTYFVYGNSVTRAKVGSYSATYNTAKTAMSALDGKIFIINGSVSANTKSYLGYWDNYNASIKTVTIKVAAPSTIQNKQVKDLYMYYSDDSDATKAEKIAMTKTSESFTPDSINSALINSSAKWAVYEVTLDANQFRAMDKAMRCGFTTGDASSRTYFSWSYNVLRAGVNSFESTYDTSTSVSLENMDGATFVMNGSASNSNARTMTGYWKTV